MSEIDSRKALERLGLKSNEVDAYFAIVGKGICLSSEIAKKANVPESEGLNICNKLVAAGLLQEIPGRTIRYKAIPPYSALLKQLEEFRDYITDLRKTVPKQLAEEFDRFETGFARVSGLGDFKNFVISVQEDIPKAMISRLGEFAERFQSFQQLDEFKAYIAKLKQTAPQEMTQKFANLAGQFDRLSKMDEFRHFVAQIRLKATNELTSRFSKIETGFSEMKKLNEIASRFNEIKTQVPQQLRTSFSSFQTEFKKVAGLEGFKDYVGLVKTALPSKIELEFAQIEQQFSQLKQLQEFATFVQQVSTAVPKQTLKEFEKFESEFRKVSGLEEFKAFMADLKQNIPRELSSQFKQFETVIKGIKGELLNVNKENFGNWHRIFGDIFEEFINAFVRDVVSDQLEKIKSMFEKEVVNGVQQILTKVMSRTETMSGNVMQSFDNLRKWMVNEVISGLQQTLQSVNQKIATASKGVTEGFGQLKLWITTQVTGDLQRTLNEVEEGATAASKQVLDTIATVSQWFDNTVVSQLTTILSGMEVKLQKAVQDAQKELSDVRGWFVKDAIEGISNTLDSTQKSVEQVSVEVNAALGKLKEWFAGEAINQLAVALGGVEARIGVASTEVVNGFSDMRNWVANDVVKTIESTLTDVTKKVSSASDAINEEVKRLREMFSSRVVNNTFTMLSGIEDRLWESEATMKAFWDKAMAEMSFRFQEVWFVQGADAMIGEIAQITSRVKAKLYICAPNIEDVDVVSLRMVSKHVDVRIAALIDPNSQKALEILKEFSTKENFRFRHYAGQNIWGVSKDMEEVILGAVSHGDVAGIGSIIDEHIKNFTPVLEHAWMEGKPIKSVEEAKLIQYKPEIKPVAPIATAQPKTPQQVVGAVKELGKKVIEEQTKKAIDESQTTINQIDLAFQGTKARMKADLSDKFKQIEDNATTLNKETLANLFAELKDFTVQKYGFSRLVFDMSKIEREYKKDPNALLSPEELSELKKLIKGWIS